MQALLKFLAKGLLPGTMAYPARVAACILYSLIGADDQSAMHPLLQYRPTKQHSK